MHIEMNIETHTHTNPKQTAALLNKWIFHFWPNWCVLRLRASKYFHAFIFVSIALNLFDTLKQFFICAIFLFYLSPPPQFNLCSAHFAHCSYLLLIFFFLSLLLPLYYTACVHSILQFNHLKMFASIQTASGDGYVQYLHKIVVDKKREHASHAKFIISTLHIKRTPNSWTFFPYRNRACRRTEWYWNHQKWFKWIA